MLTASDQGHSTEARFRTHELQDLADNLGDPGEATAGYDLKFSVRIELGGHSPEEVVKRADALFEEISDYLALR